VLFRSGKYFNVGPPCRFLSACDHSSEAKRGMRTTITDEKGSETACILDTRHETGSRTFPNRHGKPKTLTSVPGQSKSRNHEPIDIERDNKSIVTVSSNLSGLLSELLSPSYLPDKGYHQHDMPSLGVVFQERNDSQALSDFIEAQRSKTEMRADRTICSNTTDLTGLLSALLSKSAYSLTGQAAWKGTPLASTRDTLKPKNMKTQKDHNKKGTSSKGRREDRRARQLEFDYAFLGNEIIVFSESNELQP